MDPSLFLPYSPPQGLPQESKLATYMNHQATNPARQLNPGAMNAGSLVQSSMGQSSLAQASLAQSSMAQSAMGQASLSQAFGGLSLQESPPAVKKVYINEFVPRNYYASPPAMMPESPQNSPPNQMPIGQPSTQVHQENVGGTTYFYSTNTDPMNASAPMPAPPLGFGAGIDPMAGMVPPMAPVNVVSPYATQLFVGPPQHIAQLNMQQGLAASFYMPETIRSEIYERNEDVYAQPDMRHYPDLPQNVEMYSDLTPLECIVPHSIATSFRGIHRVSGEVYALRRLHALAQPSQRLDMWRNVDHPNVVKLHEYFHTKAFNDHCMVLVYDYHPHSITLMSKYLANSTNMNSSENNGPTFHDPFSSDPDAPRPYTHQKNAMLRAVASGALLPEAVLWSLIVQLTAGLRAIHSSGLACRSLDPTKVIVNGCRVRIAWGGAIDAMDGPTLSDISQAQQDDLTDLGRLALLLSCRTIHCDNIAASMELVARTYSADLKNLILYLLSSSPTHRSVNDLMPMIGARFYTQVEALERRADVFEEQLATEIDNGRLLRILIKLGVINERPELNMDPSWSETGDRYMLKLFRDYLFHAVTPEGRPWLDQAHLTHCLNQLDGGSENRVELMSRDEESILVLTYSELKHCLEASFDELMQASAVPT